MDFPILNICGDEQGELWLQKYFHLQGLHSKFQRHRSHLATQFRQIILEVSPNFLEQSMYAQPFQEPADLTSGFRRQPRMQGPCRETTDRELTPEQEA